MNSPAVYVTDVHINKYSAFAGQRNRLEDCLKVIDDCYLKANKTGAKFILMSGDLFDTVKFLYTEVVNETIARFRYWIDQYPEIVWLSITGNHDFASKNLPHKPAISSLTHLATAFPHNFRLLDNKMEQVKQDIFVCGIPNYEYSEHYKEMLTKMHDRVKKRILKGLASKCKFILMIHQKPSGQYNTKIKIETDVNDPLYDVFDMILCGDIHISQRITPKFLIGGNPLHKDLNDLGMDKGIWTLDLANPVDTLKFVNRKGRYPAFIKAPEGTTDPDNFIIPIPENIEDNIILQEGYAEAEKFNPAALSKQDLLTNYWELVGEGDKKKLQAGLKYLS